MSLRRPNPIDHLITQVDQAVRTLFGRPATTGRPHPAREAEDGELAEQERDLAVRLMRINHTGEVCAQALYQGQALTARLDTVREKMEHAAAEENDHLDWCEQRVKELGGRTSLLNPLFYAGSFAIGALAGRIGDRWSLGFVAETERQVVRHLDDHLQRLPTHDGTSRAIIEQMKIDEGQHASTAISAGAAALPLPVRLAMKGTSKLMTGSVYWV